MFSSFKSRTSSKFIMWQLDETYKFDPKIQKNYRITKLPKKSVYYLERVKEPKICTQRNLLQKLEI
jgi:hypothetical protein